jgi:cobalamin biosynthetic protein CobC
MLTYHGGRLDEAAARYPAAPQPWIDLSTGINPVAWVPPRPIEVDWGPLPSSTALRALEAAAATFFGITAERVAAVPGTEIAIRMLDAIGLPAPSHYVSPAYRSHAAAFEHASSVAIEQAAATTGTLLLANPNNPDGRLLDCDEIHALAQGRWLVVDEAFADADPACSVVPMMPPQSIVLRSFGKFFGLAGIRLGFVIAPVDIIERVRSRLGDWPVSAAAIAFGTAAYRDATWIAAARRRLPEDAHSLDVVLRRHGLEPVGACPLFRLVRCDPSMFGTLAQAGILTRPFDYAPDWLRFGLPADAAALARLDRALDGG